MFGKNKNKTKILYEDEFGITVMNGSIISEIPKGEKREYVATCFMNLPEENEEVKPIRKRRKQNNKKRNKIRKKH